MTMSAGTGKATKKSKVQVKNGSHQQKATKLHVRQGRQDVLISWAFIHVSESPTVGVDQRAADFWRHVQSILQALYKDADVQVDGLAGAGKVRLIGAKAAKKMLLNKSFK